MLIETAAETCEANITSALYPSLSFENGGKRLRERRLSSSCRRWQSRLSNRYSLAITNSSRCTRAEVRGLGEKPSYLSILMFEGLVGALACWSDEVHVDIKLGVDETNYTNKSS